MTIETKIIECENRLLQAIQNSEINTLEDLLHDDLIFIIPSGQIISKKMDIENYSSGFMKVKHIDFSDRVVSCINEIVIVSVTIHQKADFNDKNIDGIYKYLRVWSCSNNDWKVVAGSSIQIQ